MALLRYERVHTFVPKTHAAAGLFLLLKAAELSREWRKDVVVVQLDVKKALDRVVHRAAFKAMIPQSLRPFSMALTAAIGNGSAFGTVLSYKVHMSRGQTQGAPKSPVIMELVVRDLIKSWKVRELARSWDDFVLAAICYADDVVLVAASVAAAEVMVAEKIAKLKGVGLTVGAEKTH